MEIIGLLLAPVVIISFIWLLVRAFKKSAAWGFWVLLGPLLIVILAAMLIQADSIISILLISLAAYIPPVAFAYKCWEEAKKPFLTYMISSVLSLSLSVSTLASLGDDTLTSLISQSQQGIINEQDAAQRMKRLIRQMENSASLTPQEKLTIRTAQNIIKQVEMNLAKDPLYYSRESAEEDRQDIAEREAQRKKEEALKKLQEKLNQRTAKETTPTQKKPRTFPKIKKSEIRKYIGSTIIIITMQELKHKGILRGFDEEGYNIILEKERKTGKLQFKMHMSDIKKIYLYIDE